MVMPADVSVVMVLLPSAVSVENAWRAPTTDSLRRAINSFGDSVARAARRDSLQKALRDTLPPARRDTVPPARRDTIQDDSTGRRS
jgi:hypothetical protein